MTMPAVGDAIPYNNTGQIAPSVVTYASSSSGVGLYFAGSSAVLDDSIDIYDVTTGYDSGNLLGNHTTALGTMVKVGTSPGEINGGDQLVLYIDSPDGRFASVASYSADGVNHAYITPFSAGMLGSTLVPAGLYVGMEDLPNGISDFDYNDDTFVLTGLTTVTPEPGSLLLVGTGMLAAVGVLGRRRKSGVPA